MKLRNKLILSCAALAACATTMVSTTFAWYTSNKSVTATGVTGGTATTGDEMILISTNATSWDTSVQITPTGTVIDPMEYNNTTHKIYRKGGVTSADDTTGFLSFTIYIKNSSAVATGDLDMKITTLKNAKSGSLPAVPVIGAGKTALDSYADDTYTADMLRCLAMSIHTTTTANGAANSGITNTADAAYYLGTEGTPDETDIIGTNPSADALAYYKAVMGEKELAKPDTSVISTINSNKISFKLPISGTTETAGSMIQLDCKLFLDGWHAACFDACRNQSVTFGLSFTANDAPKE